MSDKLPTLPEITGIQLEGLPNSIEIGQKIWYNRTRIKDAYLRDRRYDNMGRSLAYCPWEVCLMDDTKTHAHLHRHAGSTCEWTGCDRTEVHIHKFKPLPSDPPEDVDPTGRYERVKDIMKEILGEQYQDEPLAKNIYLKLEDERLAEEAEKERQATFLANAERAGDEAMREFDQAAAERRARRADDRKKAREAEQALEQKRLARRAAKAQLLLEAETGNELERTFHAALRPSQIIENDSSVIEADASLGKRKRKRANSLLSQESSSPTSSLTDSNAVKVNQVVKEEPSPNTQRASTESSTLEVDSDTETSELTLYTTDQLDAIIGGAEVVRHEPNSLPIRTQEFPELAPNLVIGQEPVSNDISTQIATGVSTGHSGTPQTSTAEEIQPRNRIILGPMPPSLSPPRKTELSSEEEEMLARRRQIQWVLKDPRYNKSQRDWWGGINIYEDTEDSID